MKGCFKEFKNAGNFIDIYIRVRTSCELRRNIGEFYQLAQSEASNFQKLVSGGSLQHGVELCRNDQRHVTSLHHLRPVIYKDCLNMQQTHYLIPDGS